MTWRQISARKHHIWRYFPPKPLNHDSKRFLLTRYTLWHSLIGPTSAAPVKVFDETVDTNSLWVTQVGPFQAYRGNNQWKHKRGIKMQYLEMILKEIHSCTWLLCKNDIRLLPHCVSFYFNLVLKCIVTFRIENITIKTAFNKALLKKHA